MLRTSSGAAGKFVVIGCSIPSSNFQHDRHASNLPEPNVFQRIDGIPADRFTSMSSLWNNDPASADTCFLCTDLITMCINEWTVSIFLIAAFGKKCCKISSASWQRHSLHHRSWCYLSTSEAVTPEDRLYSLASAEQKVSWLSNHIIAFCLSPWSPLMRSAFSMVRFFSGDASQSLHRKMPVNTCIHECSVHTGRTA